MSEVNAQGPKKAYIGNVKKVIALCSLLTSINYSKGCLETFTSLRKCAHNNEQRIITFCMVRLGLKVHKKDLMVLRCIVIL